MKCFNYIFFFILSYVSIPLSAQTAYYQFVRHEGKNSQVTHSNMGGQYVTINGNSCYESDNKGLSVGNGVLHLYKMVDGGKCFEGNSYFGKGSRFYFSGDLIALRIETFYGDKYFYKKIVPPKGATTCSLILESSVSIENPQNSNSYGGGSVVPNTYNGSSNPTSAPSNQEDKARWETYYRNAYADWERRVQSSFNSIVEYKRKNSNNGSTSHNSFGIYTSSMISTFHQEQQEMRKVRQEAQTKGIQISPSSWETATISVY